MSVTNLVSGNLLRRRAPPVDALHGIQANDPGTKRGIEACDVEPDGSLSRRRFFCQTDHSHSDGVLVDPPGSAWTSAADGGRIWSDDARTLGHIPTLEVASNLTFGGRNGQRPFVSAITKPLAIDPAA